MTTIKKMDLTSMNITEEKKKQLKQICPEVFTEGKVDFEKLKNILGEITDTGKERYNMVWPGKKDCMKIIQQPSIATLKPCKDESVDFDTTENLFIEGDNLEVLKLLQKSYYGKVKMIYIDPPYNTGNEFIYPDNFSETLDTYLKYTGQVDSEGKKFSTNTDTDGRFHSKWLNMMYPRLYLAKNLLKDDGVIFISIDDNEVTNLRKICDEIFGEENFLGNITRATGQTTGQDSGGLGSSFDFILVYTKNTNVDLSGLPLTAKDLKRFENEDEKGKYAFDQMRKTGSNDRREDRPNMFYAIKTPDNEDLLPIAPAGYESCWRFEKKTYERLIKENFILWKKTKRGNTEIWWPYVKYYLEGRTKRPSPLWNDLEGNKKAARDLRELFDGKKYFDFPKPTSVINRIIQIVPNANNVDVILDFFSGSATTAHAVLDLNKKDNGNRKFIMVQLPEPCDEKSEAYKAGYKTIAEIGKERIRRVIKKIKDENPENKQDLGFKVFKLDHSNFKVWEGEKIAENKEKLVEQLELHIDHIDQKSNQEEILYELLLKAGFSLTTTIKKETVSGKTVFSIAEGELLICLEKQITKELVTELANREPSQIICIDKGFQGNDQLKTNVVQIIKTKNADKEKESQIVFRTV